MASPSNTTVTISLDTISRRLLERVAKALEESNALQREAMKPLPPIVNIRTANPKDETHS